MSKVHVLYISGKGDSHADRVCVIGYPDNARAEIDMQKRCREGKYWVRAEIITIVTEFSNYDNWVDI